MYEHRDSTGTYHTIGYLLEESVLRSVFVVGLLPAALVFARCSPRLSRLLTSSLVTRDS